MFINLADDPSIERISTPRMPLIDMFFQLPQEMMAMTYDSDEYLEFIKARRAQIESLVADAAKKSGRSASEIEILAASTTV